MDDVRRFIWWYEAPGQCHTDWDDTRYEQAKALMPEGAGPPPVKQEPRGSK
jgi:hypothetical protein